MIEKIRLLLLSFLILSGAFSVYSAPKKDRKQERVEQIKNDSRYYWGQGNGVTIEEANVNSLLDLSRQISATLGHSYNDDHSAVNGTELNTTTSKTSLTSFATINNTETIELRDEPNALVFRYVLKSDIDRALEDRVQGIKSMIDLAQSQERQTQLASALKYYNWALSLTTIHPKPITIEVNGQTTTAREWLMAHIPVVLGNISVDLESAEERTEGAVQPYMINLNLTYLGEPIADLEMSYHNGYKMVRGNHVKNGLVSIDFEELPTEFIELQWEYKYVDEAKRYDPAALGAFYNSFQAITFTQASVKVPIKGKNADKLKIVRKKEKSQVEPQGSSLTAPQLAERRNVIETASPEVKLQSLILDRVAKIEEAFRSNDFRSVKQFFTEHGWYQLNMMRKSVKTFEVVKLKERKMRVEQSPSFLIAGDIPLKLKYKDGHSKNEGLVMRFTADGMCESLAYALTTRAREDIFRQNRWELDARYAILKFMEDYQTAHAIQDTAYIRSIFSDDAIIITGKKDNSVRTAGKGDGIFLDDTQGYSFTTHTKDSYLRALEKDMRDHKFIDLTFENNEIALQNGAFSNIYWIEIKQFYNSQGYSDEGYLSLQLDMRKAEDPLIKVRIWQPKWVEIDELMRRFPTMVTD